MAKPRSKTITRDEILNLGGEDIQMKSVGVPVELWNRPNYKFKHGVADINKNKSDVNPKLIPQHAKDLRSRIFCFRKRGLQESEIADILNLSVERLSMILPLGATIDDD